MKIDIDVPDGESGDWRVESFEVTEQEARMANIRAWRPLERIYSGRYKRLMRGGTVVMSNTPMEISTNRPIISRATGRVLINGLGLGMALKAILQKPEVKSVLVVEKSADVLALVAPSYKDERLKIVQADAMQFKADGEFDAVWHDIWDFITSDNLPEMKTLHRRYGRKASWQGSWCRDWCER